MTGQTVDPDSAPSAGQPAPPPQPPAGWYPADQPGLERWWDGRHWTEHLRPAVQPGAHPRVSIRHERIRWAGVAWGGGGGSALSTVFGGVFVVLALPPVAFALGAREVWRAVFMLFFALVLLIGAATLFINAHFCRILERGGPPSRGTSSAI